MFLCITIAFAHLMGENKYDHSKDNERIQKIRDPTYRVECTGLGRLYQNPKQLHLSDHYRRTPVERCTNGCVLTSNDGSDHLLGTQIDDYTANVIQAQLLYLDSADPGKDISIYLNSPGGSVYAGYGIYDTMQYIGCDVATICTGMAASMASVLLVAGTKGKRFALPHSRVMIHQPLGGMQGQASDLEIAAREILRVKKELYTIISSHSGKPVEQVEKDSDRDYWMTAPEALEYGMIDKILEKNRK